jgi:protein PhnA
LNAHTELKKFLSTVIADADPGADTETARAFAALCPPERLERIVEEGRELLGGLVLEDLGTVSNRWFADAQEADSWLESMLAVFEEKIGSGDSSVETRDSNGALLAEGDSVLVIQDLKVKGGSSDLKRGTLIRKIHLTGDPAAIECRVNGSTLVLKTQFLKKA